MVRGHLGTRADDGLQSNQENVLCIQLADLRHVVVPGDGVPDPHSPPLAKKITEIKLGGFAAVAGIDPHDPQGGTLDASAMSACPSPERPGTAVRPRNPLWE